jgi:hypothetical protein
MNSLQIIKHFFTRLRCHFCSSHFTPDGVELVKEDGTVFLVNVCCSHCERHAGLAMVSLEKANLEKAGLSEDLSEEELETLNALGGLDFSRLAESDFKPRYQDPELTPAELDRLSVYEPISDNDVLDAHHFFQNLDSNWQQYLKKSS